MSDSEEDSIGSSISSDSEFSDCDSRDESPSSGYVDDESASVRSVSTANSDSKKKKKVTFQSDENLVLIREIPARGLLGRWTLESESESECDDECTQRGSEIPKQYIAKGNYEVKKSSGKMAAKVAAITGATLPKKSEGKRATRRRSVKKEKRKEIPVENSNEVEDTLKTKGKNSRVKSRKKDGSKGTKAKSKEKREQKDGVGQSAPNKTVVVSSQTESSEYKCTDSDSEVKMSTLKSCSAIQIVDLLDDSCDRDSNPIKQIEKVYIVEENYSQNSRDFLDAMIQSSDRLDVRAMSKTNRRLYSWLMANGDIPNPRQESPCIAPMWDTSCGSAQGPQNSVVRAPT